MKYLIPVVWSMYGRIEVEADTVEEAFEEADTHLNDFPLPEGFYLEDSFELDYDGIVVNNPAHAVAKLSYGRGLRVNNI